MRHSPRDLIGHCEEPAPTVLPTKSDEQRELEKEQLTNLVAVEQTRVALLLVFRLVLRRRRCETFLSFFYSLGVPP